MLVKPSAQPTLVRTQHLPHETPGQRWCRPLAHGWKGAVRNTAGSAVWPDAGQIAPGQRPGPCRAWRPGYWFAANTRRRPQAVAVLLPAGDGPWKHAAGQWRLPRGVMSQGMVLSCRAARGVGTAPPAADVSHGAMPSEGGRYGRRLRHQPGCGGDRRLTLPPAQMATDRCSYVLSRPFRFGFGQQAGDLFGEVLGAGAGHAGGNDDALLAAPEPYEPGVSRRLSP